MLYMTNKYMMFFCFSWRVWTSPYVCCVRISVRLISHEQPIRSIYWFFAWYVSEKKKKKNATMVVFHCGSCGEALKKNQVDKHVGGVCPRVQKLSCIDCGKDFRSVCLHFSPSYSMIDASVAVIPTKNTRNVSLNNKNTAVRTTMRQRMWTKVKRNRINGSRSSSRQLTWTRVAIKRKSYYRNFNTIQIHRENGLNSSYVALCSLPYSMLTFIDRTSPTILSKVFLHEWSKKSGHCSKLWYPR